MRETTTDPEVLRQVLDEIRARRAEIEVEIRRLRREERALVKEETLTMSALINANAREKAQAESASPGL